MKVGNTSRRTRAEWSRRHFSRKVNSARASLLALFTGRTGSKQHISIPFCSKIVVVTTQNLPSNSYHSHRLTAIAGGGSNDAIRYARQGGPYSIGCLLRDFGVFCLLLPQMPVSFVMLL